MPGNANTVYIGIDVDDRGRVAVRRLGDEADRAGRKGERGLKKTNRELKDVERHGDRAGRTMRGVSGIMSRLGAIAGGLTAAGSLGGVVHLFKDGTMLAAQWDRQLRRTNALLKSTGYAAGFTARELNELAKERDLATLGDKGSILDAINILQTFKSVQGDVFRQAIITAQDLAEVTGQDLRSSMTMLGKALEDPLLGLTAMRRVGVSFSEAEKDMVKSLVEANRKMEAQANILKILQEQYGGAAEGAAGGMLGVVDTLSYEWREFKESLEQTDAAVSGIRAVTEALRAMRAEMPNTAEGRLERVDRRLRQFRGQEKSPWWYGLAPSLFATTEENLTAERRQIIQEMQRAFALEDQQRVQSRATQASLAAASAPYRAPALSLGSMSRMPVPGLAAMTDTDKAMDRLEDMARAEEEFADRYKRITMDRFAYARHLIEQDYKEYQGLVEDKTALDMWRAQELAAINAEEAAEKKKLYEQERTQLDRLMESYRDWGAQWENITITSAQASARAFDDFFFNVVTGRFDDVGDVALQFGQSILRSVTGSMGQQITAGLQPGFSSLFSSFTGLFNAHGNAFPGGISAHSNTIVDRPTLFAFARGAGVMGEAGPEAIMPLTRTRGGNLGVRAEMAMPKIVINVINQSGQQADAQVKPPRLDGGQIVYDVLLDKLARDPGARNAVKGVLSIA